MTFSAVTVFISPELVASKNKRNDN